MSTATTQAPASTANALDRLDLSPHRVLRNLSSADLIERAIAAGEGTLAANGALVCLTGDRTGRSPNSFNGFGGHRTLGS